MGLLFQHFLESFFSFEVMVAAVRLTEQKQLTASPTVGTCAVMQSVMLVPITFGIVLAIFALVAFIVLIVRGHSNDIGMLLRVGGCFLCC